MGLNRYKYLVRTYATLYYLGADRVPGAARHTGSCARAASLSPGSVTAGSWHSVAGYLAVLPIAHVGYLRAATRRWQGGVADTRRHSLKRAAMARVPLVVTASDWALATEDDNHANDGRAPVALGRYPPLFLG